MRTTMSRLRRLAPRARTIRRLTQAGAALFVAALAAAHTLAGEDPTSAAAAPSPEAFCPFGGVETLYASLSGGGLISHTHLSNLVLLGAVLLLALVARGAFCGWICPLGAIQEWIYAAGRWAERRVPALARARRELRRRLGARPPRVGMLPEPTLIHRIDGALRYAKYVVLALILGGTIATGVMVFRDYDPWSALLEVGSLELTAGTAVLAVVLLASLVVERPWCRYACPLGAAIGLAGALSPLRVQRAGAACTGCALCTKACPMGLKVATMSQLTHRDCIMCLECVDSCPQPGALDLRLSIPGAPAEHR